jgi:hypothetical protein
VQNLRALLGIFFGTLLPIGSLALAAEPASEEQIVAQAVCKKPSETRRLEAHTKDAGCVLHYHKDGKDNQIAKARRGVDVCTENLEKVRKTLEGGGFKCE